MTSRMRLFSEARSLQAVHICAFTLILSISAVVIIVPGHTLHEVAGWPLWTHTGIAPARATDGMFWLLYANMVSVIAVSLLIFELETLKRKCLGLSFRLDDARVQQRGLKAPDLSKFDESAIKWAINPLLVTFVVSFLVLMVMVFAFVVTLVSSFPQLTTRLFVTLTLLTGFLYLSAMTFGDVCARVSYKRCTCLLLEKTDKPRQARNEHVFDDFIDALSDYDILIRYVDAPVLLSLGAITLFKFASLGDHDGYHFGFVAGTVAMHIIIANLVSLIIVSIRTRVEIDTI